MSEVVEGLFLGSIEDSRNQHFIQQKKISHLLTAAKEIAPQSGDFTASLHLKLKDRSSFDLLPHLDEAVTFIHRCLLDGGRILVHCQAGVSRSASLVVAYLVRCKQLNLEEAIRVCRQTRSAVSPNKGFLKQLQIYANLHRVPLPSNPSDSSEVKARLERADGPSYQAPIHSPFKTSSLELFCLKVQKKNSFAEDETKDSNPNY